MRLRRFLLRIPQHKLEEHAKELDELLAERNWFVHHGLAEVDFSSEQACAELLGHLEDQNEQIGKQIDFLLPIARSLRDVGKFITSDEGKELLFRELLADQTQNDT